MVLRDLTRIPKVVPRPCSTEEMQREIGKIGNALQDIINNVNEIQGDNNLQLNVDGGGTVPMQAKFAISLGDDETNDPPTFIPPSADNGWRGFIKALACEDSSGANPNPTAIWVVLPGRDDISITLPVGNVFAYELADSGEYVIVSDYSEARGEDVLWGVAQADSVNTPVPLVSVRKCDDISGANPVAPDINVLLPPHDGSLNDVKLGDVIAYTTAKDGTYVAVSDYTKPDLVRWVKCTANAVTNLGVPHTVLAQFCDNEDGDNPAGAAFAVLLPRTAFTDSYVKLNDVLAVEEDENGAWVAVSDYSAHTFYENGVAIGTQPRSNFIDTATIAWDIVEDGANGEVEIKANFIDTDDTQPWIQFTLTTNMSTGSATADVDDFWNGPNPGASVTVHDRHDLFSRAKIGAQGLAHWDFTNDDWVIVECESLAGWVHGKMLANMAGSPLKGSFQVDGYGGTQQDIQNPGTTIDVYALTGLTDDLVIDDYSYCVLDAIDGLYYAVTPRPATTTDYRPRYCKAQHQWEKNSGNPRVSVKTLTGHGGTETGTAFYVYLRSTHYAKDPNVHIGQDFLYEQDIDGEYITLDPNCYDDLIGTVKELEDDYDTSSYGTLSGGKAISGWAFQDGTLNATADGGSGKDWTTNNGATISNAEAPPIYIAPVTTSATNPGNALWPSDTSLAHTHTLTLTAGAVTLSIDDHPDHRHKVSETYENTFAGTGGSGIPCISWVDTHSSSPQLNYSGGAVAIGGGGHSDTDHTALTLSHSGTASAADPTGTLAATYQQVFYKRVAKIERIDNSFEVLGI